MPERHLMWVTDGHGGVRMVLAEVSGHPANKVWRVVETDRQYQEGRDIFANKQQAERMADLPPAIDWSRLDPTIADAVVLVQRYGVIDGAHHKQWVIDQMLRTLLGDKRYADWRRAYGDDWDEGIAP